MKLPAQHTDTLRGIHLPDAISWWPPAIGWWILLALIIAGFIFVPKAYRYLTFTPYNKVAKIAFDNIVLHYDNDKDATNLLIETSKLLRQIAMTCYGRENIAQLTGNDWIQTLNNMSEENHFTDDIKEWLINAPYQKNISIDPKQLISTVHDWLVALPKQPERIKK